MLVYCVNDAAVMGAWAADQGVKGSMISFLADTRSELTVSTQANPLAACGRTTIPDRQVPCVQQEALDVVLDDAGVMGALGNPRCKRFACFIDDGVIKSFFVSEAPDE